jgi:hypothetical protein
MAKKAHDPDVKALPGVVENMLSPEVFASEATLMSIGLGVVTITFTSLRWDNASSPPRQQKVVIGRLTMPISGARSLAAGPTDFLGKHGIEPPQRPDDPKQVQ